MQDKIYIDNPKVQILMATYNGEDFLVQQLESILSQTYINWELLISDDGSSDGTLEILREYERKHSDKIKLVSNGKKNRGACANFFYLVSEASADYMMFCDQDDYWKRDKIEVTLKKMTQAEDELASDTPVLVFTDLEIADDKLNTISKSYLRYSNLTQRKSI